MTTASYFGATPTIQLSVSVCPSATLPPTAVVTGGQARIHVVGLPCQLTVTATTGTTTETATRTLIHKNIPPTED